MLTNDQIENNWICLIQSIYEWAYEDVAVDAVQYTDLCDSILEMMDGLSKDVVIDGETYVGFINAPAGVGQHHNYPGGLVEHLHEMWDTYLKLRDALPKSQAELNHYTVIPAIIIHDLHKAYKTYRYLKDDEKVGKNANRTFAYANSPETNLLTQDQHSAMILSRFNVQLPIIVLNSLYCSEGGYKVGPPNVTSALAKFVYLLDEFSSNVLYRIMNPRKGIDYI